MKRTFSLLTVTLCTWLIAGSALAATIYTIAPGGFNTALSSVYPVGGTAIASLSAPFSSSTLVGTITSTVIQNDASNPYGGLTFEYQLFMDPASPQAASRFTVSSFGSFLTDVSYNPSASLLGLIFNPTSFGRSADGQVLRFSFDNPNIGAGQDSAMIVVQTSAGLYGNGVAAVIDGTSANAVSLVPVPEPAAAGLLLLGLCASAVRRARRP